MPEPIPALTLWQPWASLIAIGVKPFETRSWATRYRGPLAIHAGTERRGLRDAREVPAIFDALAAARLTPAALPLGCIVAVVDLTACWPTEAIVADGLDDPFGDYGPGRFGWHLARVRPLPEPIHCSGRQRLWRPPAAVQTRLRALLASPPTAFGAGARTQDPGRAR